MNSNSSEVVGSYRLYSCNGVNKYCLGATGTCRRHQKVIGFASPYHTIQKRSASVSPNQKYNQKQP